MLDYQNQIFILKNITNDYYKDGEKMETPQGGNYIVQFPGVSEATIKIPGRLLLNKPKADVYQAVIFKDLDMRFYARENQIKGTGTASDVMIICEDILGLVASSVSQDKPHNLKVKTTE